MIIQVDGLSSFTLYSIVFDMNGLAWNGTALEGFGTGHWSVYAIPMTYDGGGVFTATFPSALPAADYRVVTYLQGGTSPDPSDLVYDNKVYSTLLEESISAQITEVSNAVVVPADPLKCRVTGYAAAGPDGVKAGRVYTFTLYGPPQFDSNGVGIYFGPITRYSDEDGKVIVDLNQGQMYQVYCQNQGINNVKITIPSASTALLSVLIG